MVKTKFLLPIFALLFAQNGIAEDAQSPFAGPLSELEKSEMITLGVEFAGAALFEIRARRLIGKLPAISDEMASLERLHVYRLAQQYDAIEREISVAQHIKTNGTIEYNRHLIDQATAERQAIQEKLDKQLQRLKSVTANYKPETIKKITDRIEDLKVALAEAEDDVREFQSWLESSKKSRRTGKEAAELQKKLKSKKVALLNNSLKKGYISNGYKLVRGQIVDAHTGKRVADEVMASDMERTKKFTTHAQSDLWWKQNKLSMKAYRSRLGAVALAIVGSVSLVYFFIDVDDEEVAAAFSSDLSDEQRLQKLAQLDDKQLDAAMAILKQATSI
ncbi:MAG: hypothetical protein KDD33_03260 [Bdellovibrionales bacterium]|nr:hypothetical protein [Bdellovibrionales bacterium]